MQQIGECTVCNYITAFSPLLSFDQEKSNVKKDVGLPRRYNCLEIAETDAQP